MREGMNEKGKSKKEPKEKWKHGSAQQERSEQTWNLICELILLVLKENLSRTEHIHMHWVCYKQVLLHQEKQAYGKTRSMLPTAQVR
jgi:hypothetical protein